MRQKASEPAKDRTPQIVGEVAQATLALLRRECPGWDFWALHEEFRAWLLADPSRTPANYQNAFIGFVRRYDAKNRFQLGR